jgi:dienelactone hydrolase
MVPETFDSGGRPISTEVYLPAGAGPHPAVVIAYGTEGMNEPFGSAIQSFARDLAASGYVALIPHYFNRTDTPAGHAAYELFAASRDLWVETLGDAVSYAAARSDVDRKRIGLLGFSMGGHLALRRAKLSASVNAKAVVDFFAPISMGVFSGIGDGIANLPPVQIHHGNDDGAVPPAESHELIALLEAAGKRENIDYEKYFYPGEGHGFQGASAVSSSIQRTADFFSRHLV